MPLGRSSTHARPATRCMSGNSPEETEDETLCRRWRHRHRISAARQLAKRYWRLIVQLAGIHRASGLRRYDPSGASQLGLMRALCRFDPNRGVGFSTYATWWVAFTLHDCVLMNASTPIGRARVDELLRADFGCAPIRQLWTAARSDLRLRQQTALATVASDSHRRADDATCGRI